MVSKLSSPPSDSAYTVFPLFPIPNIRPPWSTTPPRTLATQRRASYLRPIRIWTRNARNLEDSIDDTTDTLAGDQASSDRVAVDVEVLGVFLGPEVRGQRAHQHGGTVVGLGQDEGETDALLFVSQESTEKKVGFWEEGPPEPGTRTKLTIMLGWKTRYFSHVPR